MMFKKRYIFILSIIVLGVIAPTIKSSADTINKGILFLYDSSNVYGTTQNMLNEVNMSLIESGEKVDIKKTSFNKEENLNGYSKIVILNCNTENFSKKFLSEINKNESRVIYISNILNTGVKYKTRINLNNLSQDLFRDEILSSLGMSSSENRYLMINNVTPFMNLNDLVSKIKYLNQQGIPFIINTIPVFENPTFKSMQNFTEVLRYAQASGGCIVMSTPYINQGGATANEIFNAMTEGYNNYINYLVYPIAFEAPSYLLYREDLKSDLEKGNTIFINETSVDTSWLTDYSNPRFKNLVQEVPYNSGKINDIKNMNGNIAVTVNGALENSDFENDIQELINNGVFFESPRNLNTSVEINGNKIECSANGTYLNGKYVQQNTYISNEELFKQNSNNNSDANKNDINISGASKKLAVFAIIVCIIFIIITILSKRIDRKKYFR